MERLASSDITALPNHLACGGPVLLGCPIVIGPYQLRHDGADGVELTCIHFDSRPARQPDDNTARGRYDSHRAEDVPVLRDGALTFATGCAIFRTHGPTSPEWAELL
jgi:hypothetical protein